MYERLIFPIGMFFNIMPFAFLCYFPFMHRLRISKKALLIITILYSATQFAINYCFYDMSVQNARILFSTYFVISFLIYFFTIRMSFSKILFVFLVVANYAAFIVASSNFLIAHFYPEYSVEGYNIHNIVITGLLFIITAPFIIYILHKKIKSLLDINNDKVWNTLWAIPLTFLVSLVAVTGEHSKNLIESWQYITITVTMAIGSFIIFYLVIKMLIETDENATLRENVRMTARQLALQEEQYKNLNEHIAEARTARHDLRHHLSIIEAYLESDDKKQLREYLNEYRTSMPEDTELVICENYAVNAIVLHYAGIAKAEGISVSIKIKIPQEIKISNSDLCIVFGNCLENALEACRRMESGREYLNIRSALHGNMLVITIDNSFDGVYTKYEGKFFSRKRDNEEGIGISSVRAVANKYNGSAQFEAIDTEFQASVMLNSAVIYTQRTAD